jgi:uncharacterized protein with von Willebrand factor type A (vWA) domain
MFGDFESESLPNLLLVIDSSGSMTWSMRGKNVSGPYHTALVSAFAAMDVALRKGSRVAAINFSDGTRICDWTRERSTVEKVLLAYQGGGTVAPNKKVADSCDAAGSGVMILMITDAEIANWGRLIKSISKLTRRGHKYFMFHIESPGYELEAKTLADLTKAGATAIPVKSVKDLPGLVVREVRSVYRS